MSKYDALWAYVQKDGSPTLKLTFGQIQEIAGIPIDHSFLQYKKELTDYWVSGRENLYSHFACL